MARLPTIRLFAPSFWRGLVSVLDITGTLGSCLKGRSTDNHDRDTVREDWASVKTDLERAWQAVV